MHYHILKGERNIHVMVDVSARSPGISKNSVQKVGKVSIADSVPCYTVQCGNISPFFKLMIITMIVYIQFRAKYKK